MSSSQIFLHPLVIMNIADHQARAVAESTSKYDPKNPPRVLGAVFGIQVGQRVEIMSSVELPYELDDEKQIRINDDEFGEDRDLYGQVYPEHELLGWYSTESKIEDIDMPFHKRFTEYNEGPLYIRMDPKVRSDAKTRALETAWPVTTATPRTAECASEISLHASLLTALALETAPSPRTAKPARLARTSTAHLPSTHALALTFPPRLSPPR